MECLEGGVAKSVTNEIASRIDDDDKTIASFLYTANRSAVTDFTFPFLFVIM